MLGSLLMSAGFAIRFHHRLPDSYVFPMRFRLVFMVLIGVMVGAKVTPDIVTVLPRMGLSLLGLILFVLAAQLINYQIFHRLGELDRATAFYAGSPGGLLEAMAMGEAAGANMAQLSLLQFLRVIAVIMIVPLGLSLYSGAALGSAGGQSLASTGASLTQLPLALLVGLIGYGVGRAIRLPAGQLTGPLLAAALYSVTTGGDLGLPDWVINLCQVVIGASLGMRFVGVNLRDLSRATALSLMSVTFDAASGPGCRAGIATADRHWL